MTEVAARSRAQLLVGPMAFGAVGVGSLVALHLRDPHESGSWGFCPFFQLTGYPCPGCGGLRAVNNLTNADVAGAIGSNPMAVALVAFFFVAGVVWLGRRLAGQDVPILPHRPAWSVGVPVAFAIGFVVLGIVRLTPWGAALRP